METSTLRTSSFHTGTAGGAGGEYKSRMLEKYLWFLTKCEKPQVFDAGPVRGSTISFFLQYVSKLHVCDLLLRSGVSGNTSAAPEQSLIQMLNYDQRSLDAVHLWDIPDHFNNTGLAALVKSCLSIIKPGGLLIFIASNSPEQQSFRRFLDVNKDCNVTVQQAVDLKLPYYHRSNRDIQIALEPFDQQASFLYMNGIREFIFKSPSEPIEQQTSNPSYRM